MHHYHALTVNHAMTLQDSEKFLSEMVSGKLLWAKIDRPHGIVTFSKPETPASTLNGLAGDISQLLSLVEKTTHLIHKENMHYAIR